MDSEKKSTISIKYWSADERPREKLQQHGPSVLSNSELLAILINSGTREKSAIELAREILELGRNNLNELGKLNLKDLQKIKGIGEAKAITIAAALELGRRRHTADEQSFTRFITSKDLANYLRTKYADHNHEVFVVLFMNHSNKLIKEEVISRGGITGTVADPVLILKNAILHESKALVLCHNHPSGNLRPSNADKTLTEKLKLSAALMDIRVLDHIIISDEGYFSFADEGIL